MRNKAKLSVLIAVLLVSMGTASAYTSNVTVQAGQENYNFAGIDDISHFFAENGNGDWKINYDQSTATDYSYTNITVEFINQSDSTVVEVKEFQDSTGTIDFNTTSLPEEDYVVNATVEAYNSTDDLIESDTSYSKQVTYLPVDFDATIKNPSEYVVSFDTSFGMTWDVNMTKISDGQPITQDVNLRLRAGDNNDFSTISTHTTTWSPDTEDTASYTLTESDVIEGEMYFNVEPLTEPSTGYAYSFNYKNEVKEIYYSDITAFNQLPGGTEKNFSSQYDSLQYNIDVLETNINDKYGEGEYGVVVESSVQNSSEWRQIVATSYNTSSDEPVQGNIKINEITDTYSGEQELQLRTRLWESTAYSNMLEEEFQSYNLTQQDIATIHGTGENAGHNDIVGRLSRYFVDVETHQPGDLQTVILDSNGDYVTGGEEHYDLSSGDRIDTVDELTVNNNGTYVLAVEHTEFGENYRYQVIDPQLEFFQEPFFDLKTPVLSSLGDSITFEIENLTADASGSGEVLVFNQDNGTVEVQDSISSAETYGAQTYDISQIQEGTQILARYPIYDNRDVYYQESTTETIPYQYDAQYSIFNLPEQAWGDYVRTDGTVTQDGLAFSENKEVNAYPIDLDSDRMDNVQVEMSLDSSSDFEVEMNVIGGRTQDFFKNTVLQPGDTKTIVVDNFQGADYLDINIARDSGSSATGQAVINSLRVGYDGQELERQALKDFGSTSYQLDDFIAHGVNHTADGTYKFPSWNFLQKVVEEDFQDGNADDWVVDSNLTKTVEPEGFETDNSIRIQGETNAGLVATKEIPQISTDDNYELQADVKAENTAFLLRDKGYPRHTFGIMFFNGSVWSTSGGDWERQTSMSYSPDTWFRVATEMDDGYIQAGIKNLNTTEPGDDNWNYVNPIRANKDISEIAVCNVYVPEDAYVDQDLIRDHPFDDSAPGTSSCWDLNKDKDQVEQMDFQMSDFSIKQFSRYEKVVENELFVENVEVQVADTSDSGVLQVEQLNYDTVNGNLENVGSEVVKSYQSVTGGDTLTIPVNSQITKKRFEVKAEGTPTNPTTVTLNNSNDFYYSGYGQGVKTNADTNGFDSVPDHLTIPPGQEEISFWFVPSPVRKHAGGQVTINASIPEGSEVQFSQASTYDMVGRGNTIAGFHRMDKQRVQVQDGVQTIQLDNLRGNYREVGFETFKPGFQTVRDVDTTQEWEGNLSGYMGVQTDYGVSIGGGGTATTIPYSEPVDYLDMKFQQGMPAKVEVKNADTGDTVWSKKIYSHDAEIRVTDPVQQVLDSGSDYQIVFTAPSDGLGLDRMQMNQFDSSKKPVIHEMEYNYHEDREGQVEVESVTVNTPPEANAQITPTDGSTLEDKTVYFAFNLENVNASTIESTKLQATGFSKQNSFINEGDVIIQANIEPYIDDSSKLVDMGVAFTAEDGNTYKVEQQNQYNIDLPQATFGDFRLPKEGGNVATNNIGMFGEVINNNGNGAIELINQTITIANTGSQGYYEFSPEARLLTDEDNNEIPAGEGSFVGYGINYGYEDLRVEMGDALNPGEAVTTHEIYYNGDDGTRKISLQRNVNLEQETQIISANVTEEPLPNVGSDIGYEAGMLENYNQNITGTVEVKFRDENYDTITSLTENREFAPSESESFTFEIPQEVGDNLTTGDNYNVLVNTTINETSSIRTFGGTWTDIVESAPTIRTVSDDSLGDFDEIFSEQSTDRPIKVTSEEYTGTVDALNVTVKDSGAVVNEVQFTDYQVGSLVEVDFPFSDNVTVDTQIIDPDVEGNASAQTGIKELGADMNVTEPGDEIVIKDEGSETILVTGKITGTDDMAEKKYEADITVESGNETHTETVTGQFGADSVTLFSTQVDNYTVGEEATVSYDLRITGDNVGSEQLTKSNVYTFNVAEYVEEDEGGEDGVTIIPEGDVEVEDYSWEIPENDSEIKEIVLESDVDGDTTISLTVPSGEECKAFRLERQDSTEYSQHVVYELDEGDTLEIPVRVSVGQEDVSCEVRTGTQYGEIEDIQLEAKSIEQTPGGLATGQFISAPSFSGIGNPVAGAGEAVSGFFGGLLDFFTSLLPF